MSLRNQSRRAAICGMLIALALSLAWAERLFPLQLLIPLPGLRIGLANIVSLIALQMLGLKSTCAIWTIKCLLSAGFSGNAIALAFSLAGGFLSLFTMTAARRLRFLSIYGVSVLGAAAHSIGQIFICACISRTMQIAAYLPWLLCISIPCGLATAAAASGVLRARIGSRNLLPSEESTC